MSLSWPHRCHVLSFRPAVLLLALATGITSRGSAQLGRIQISGEVTTGSGARTDHAGETWYIQRRSRFGSIAMALTFPAIGGLQPLVMVDRSSTVAGDPTAICGIAPNGTCMRYFPGLAGYSAGAGVRAHLASALDLDVVAGFGSMSGPSKYVAANLAVALSRHARVVAGVRHIVIQHSSGDELWWRPVTVGLRIQ
jgi:hypothetical protein